MAQYGASSPRAAVFFQFVRLGALITSLILSFTIGSARAQTETDLASVGASLTQSLAALNARYHSAAPTERTQLLKNLLVIAADRQQVLADLMEDHPEEVLRLALPDALRNSLPPAVQSSIESR